MLTAVKNGQWTGKQYPEYTSAKHADYLFDFHEAQGEVLLDWPVALEFDHNVVTTPAPSQADIDGARKDRLLRYAKRVAYQKAQTIIGVELDEFDPLGHQILLALNAMQTATTATNLAALIASAKVVIGKVNNGTYTTKQSIATATDWWNGG